jgi:hypothetical protein
LRSHLARQLARFSIARYFITRIKINASIEYQQVFTNSYSLRDRLVKIGWGTKKTPIVTLRLIEIRKCLGTVKRQRKRKPKLIIAPFPDKKRGDDQFFFQSPPKPSLTTSLQA